MTADDCRLTAERRVDLQVYTDEQVKWHDGLIADCRAIEIFLTLKRSRSPSLNSESKRYISNKRFYTGSAISNQPISSYKWLIHKALARFEACQQSLGNRQQSGPSAAPPGLAAKLSPRAGTCTTMADTRQSVEPGDWRTTP
jgi:hypothetical protein